MNEDQIQFETHTHDGIDSMKILQSSFVSVVLANTTPATAGNYGVFFIATRPCYVKSVYCSFTTAGSSTPTLQLERLTSGIAPDSGSVLLETAFDLALTANVPQLGVLLKGTSTSLRAGDRLCLKDIGTLTAIAGLTVTAEIAFT